MKLNSKLQQPGYFARAAGYGESAYGKGDTNGPAKFVDIPVISSVRCAVFHFGDLGVESIVGVGIQDKIQFCSGYEDGQCSVCRGDSGGPLLVYDSSNTAVQIGITSFGADASCDAAKRPAIFTQVSAYLEWIESKGVPITTSADGQLHEGDGSEASLLDKINPLCFPADALVYVKDEGTKQMKDLSIGDLVLTSNNTYSEIFMFTHQDANVAAEFINIYYDGGKEPIALSAGHYVFLNGNIDPASKARLGDELVVANGKAAKIINISTCTKRGLFNTQTASGTIVANNVKASTYTTAIAPNLAHSLLRPISSFYALFRIKPSGKLISVIEKELRKTVSLALN